MAFQNGTSPDPAYGGGDDTYLSQTNASTNYGGAATCLADGDDPPGTGGDLSCLLRWDLRSIPSGSQVTGATITLNVTNASGSSYPVFQVLQPWVESQATWNVYASGQPWGVAGALGSIDRAATSLAAIASSSIGLHTFNLDAAGIAAVQAWIDMPGSNHGLIIANAGVNNGADFSSNEAGTASNRPKLTVQYLSGTVVTPPTAIATATATATPNPRSAIHVGDLDPRSARRSSSWTASVTITAHDGSHNPLSSVLVAGSWSGGGSGTASCTTGTNGQCTVSLRLPSSTGQVQFNVTGLTKTGSAYAGSANHDPEGDSTGTVVIVTR